MLKKELIKKRSGDENIGKLIVFAVTIIIAVGVLGTLAYFYNQSREKSVKISVLSSTASNTEDIKGQKFCDTDTTTAYIKYEPLNDEYGIYCKDGSASETEIKNAGARIINPCTKLASEDSVSPVCYKLNK